MRRLARSAIIITAVLGFTTLVEAQVYTGGDAPHRGSLEVSGGGTFATGFDLGSLTAELTRSTPTERFDLFTTDSEVSGFPGAYARLGYYLSDSISVEGGIRYTRPRLSVRLSADAEAAPNETAEETISQYLFDGSLVWHLRHLSFASGRGIPYLAGGAGYIRELHEGRQLVETGQEYHAVGGLNYWLGSGERRFGVRFEGGVSMRQDGLEPDGDLRLLPIVFGGLSYVF